MFPMIVVCVCPIVAKSVRNSNQIFLSLSFSQIRNESQPYDCPREGNRESNKHGYSRKYRSETEIRLVQRNTKKTGSGYGNR